MKKQPAIKITEKQFREQIIDLCKLFRWSYYFTWNSKHSPKGFPDLVLVRGRRLVFAELKSHRRKVTPEQGDWLDALRNTGKCETYVWWASGEIDQIVRILK